MIKNKINLIALDIDGTIMNSQYLISDKMKETISKAINTGVYVVLATGRMHNSTIPVASELGITTPLVTYQGSLIKEFHKSKEVLLQHTIKPELSKLIIEELRKLGVQINVYYNDELYTEDENNIVVSYAKQRSIAYNKVKSLEEILDFDLLKILAINENSEKITEITQYLSKKYSDILNITRSSQVFCEFVNKKASKGNAVLYLAKKWNIPKSEIMVIGDHDNDIDMLKIAGMPVAMGNGTEKLKKFASHVTDTVDNDGAALAIEKFVLGI